MMVSWMGLPVWQVILFWNQEFGVIAAALEVLHYGSGDFTVVLVLPEASVRRAFASGIFAVAVVNQYFNLLWVLRRLYF